MSFLEAAEFFLIEIKMLIQAIERELLLLGLFLIILSWNVEICDEVMRILPYVLAFVPDHFKIQEMCDEAIHITSFLLNIVLDCSKAKEMCNKAIRIRPILFFIIPNCLKTQEISNKPIRIKLSLLTFSPWLLQTTRNVLKQLKNNHVPWYMSFIVSTPMQWVVTHSHWCLFSIISYRYQKCSTKTLMTMKKSLRGFMVINGARPKNYKIKKSLCLLLGIP